MFSPYRSSTTEEFRLFIARTGLVRYRIYIYSTVINVLVICSFPVSPFSTKTFGIRVPPLLQRKPHNGRDCDILVSLPRPQTPRASQIPQKYVSQHEHPRQVTRSARRLRTIEQVTGEMKDLCLCLRAGSSRAFVRVPFCFSIKQGWATFSY